MTSYLNKIHFNPQSMEGMLNVDGVYKVWNGLKKTKHFPKSYILYEWKAKQLMQVFISYNTLL